MDLNQQSENKYIQIKSKCEQNLEDMTNEAENIRNILMKSHK